MNFRDENTGQPRRWWFGGAALLLGTMAVGCADPSLPPKMDLLNQGAPYLYTDQDWAAVLRDHVREGLVDYEKLSRSPDALERYYALLSVTGPSTTPSQFPSSGKATAYWINAYNALVLRAVLEKYPVTTMYDLSMPRLETEHWFRVDGQLLTLAMIEEEILKSSRGDVRGLFATSRAAMGTPRLSPEPMRADTLDRQLAAAAAAALDNPAILQIDHVNKAIFVWQVILRREKEFVDYWRSRRRVRTAYLYNVLLELGSRRQRRALQASVGYTIRCHPFERGLNEAPRDGGQTVAP